MPNPETKRTPEDIAKRIKEHAEAMKAANEATRKRLEEAEKQKEANHEQRSPS